MFSIQAYKAHKQERTIAATLVSKGHKQGGTSSQASLHQWLRKALINPSVLLLSIYSASLRVAILICDIEQVISVTLMDSSKALALKKKAGIVNSR